MDDKYKNKLIALMKGLEFPDPEAFMEEHEDVFFTLGKCIAEKASGKSADEVDAAERVVEAVIIGSVIDMSYKH